MLARTEITTAELREVAERIRLLRKQATEHALEIGRELLRVKASLPHGAFVKWVEKECEFKVRTAQDLMKLAREVDSNAQLVALMVPSTLRIYLSKTTPPAVRKMVLNRLENGETISRSELATAISNAKPKPTINTRPVIARSEGAPRNTPDLLTVGGGETDSEIGRARKVATILVNRLTREEYEFIMNGMNWGIWNKVFVWMRAACNAFNEQHGAAVLTRKVGT